MSFSKLILKNTVVQRYSNTFEGPLVTKHRGERAPNGLTWVHSPSDLFHVDGIPGQHEAIWSRSMIKEFLDTHPNVDLEPPFEASDRGDLQPRRLKPWSVLNIPKSPGSDVEEWCVNGSHAAPSPNGVGKADDLGTLSMCSKEQGDNDTVVLSAAPSPQQQDHTEVAMQNGEGVTEATIAPAPMPDQSPPATNANDSDGVAQTANGIPSCEPTTVAVSQDVSMGEPLDTDLYPQIKGLPRLEEFIPDEFMPDILFVHDCGGVVPIRNRNRVSGPMKYRRWTGPLPESEECASESEESESSMDEGSGSSMTEESGSLTTPAEPRVAHLYLLRSYYIDAGNHSSVYRAPILLPSPLSVKSPNHKHVTVVAKVSARNYHDMKFLHNEGKTYLELPRHLQEGWCGYNPVPTQNTFVPLCPVVPKFYGYYVPEGTKDDDWNWNLTLSSPILLMEDCGKKIDPSCMSDNEKFQCYWLFRRLHRAGWVQGSTYPRNILEQPGPLSLPPDERSAATPSFRVIDFGRAEQFDDPRTSADVSYTISTYRSRQWQNDEVRRIRRELCILPGLGEPGEIEFDDV